MAWLWNSLKFNTGSFFFSILENLIFQIAWTVTKEISLMKMSWLILLLFLFFLLLFMLNKKEVESCRFWSRICKFGMVYTLTCRSFKICSNWTKFHEGILLLKEFFFWNNLVIFSFINNCFKLFFNKLFIKHPQIIKVEKKNLCLSLLYLQLSSLQIRSNLRKFFKGSMKCYKLPVAFKV